jgi:hypothetical protein
MECNTIRRKAGKKCITIQDALQKTAQERTRWKASGGKNGKQLMMANHPRAKMVPTEALGFYTQVTSK